MDSASIFTCIASVLCVTLLHPIYIHLLTWKRPTALSLSTFGLDDATSGNLVIRSHLKMVDATASMKTLLKGRDAILPSLTTGTSKKDKFTILMPSYKRTNTLKYIFDHYCVMDDIVDRLIIVWNNVGEVVPDWLKQYNCRFPITFKEQEKNSLNNRFVLYPEIQTECVLSLDDDRVISKQTLIDGFNMWKIFPNMLVGYIARVHGYSDITHSYYYRVHGVTTPQLYSITLTIAAFLHQKYLDEYTKNLPKEAKEFVNRNINCEDMFMVAMINEFMKKNYQSQCVCLWVDEVADNLENARIGLSSDRSHYTERDECLNLMVKLFNGFPLNHCSLYIGKKD